jgi:hypothetical protein
MALLIHDGFETLGDSGNDPNDTVFSQRYYSAQPAGIQIATGKYNRRCFFLNAGAGIMGTYSGRKGGPYSTDTTKIWGLSLLNSGRTSGAYYIIRWITDTDFFACGLKAFDDGSLILYDRSGSTLAIGPPGMIRIQAWNRIEVKLYYHTSAGTIEVKVNGKTALTATGIDTAGVSGSYHVRAYLYNDIAKSRKWDDWYVCDTSGSTFNDFLGPITCIAHYPTGDDLSEWSPSAGADHYLLVDEAEPDNATTYVEGTNGTEDKFTTTNLTGVSTICAVTLGVDYALDVAGDRDIRQVLESGGTDYPGDTITVNTTDYIYYYDLWDQDPDTSSAWTVNGYNATKIGVEVVA